MKRALLSVSDKTGIVDFAKQLSAHGIEIVSTGGTAELLAERGVLVRAVADVTGMPEMMGGRLKTLHPKVLGGLLARRDVDAEDMKAHEIEPIDLVVVNLYPFGQVIKKPGVTQEQAIENIDIGGPTMIRAAAKNWKYVAVVVDPIDYDRVLAELVEHGSISADLRKSLMVKAFQHTAYYDSLIGRYFSWPMAGQDSLVQQLTIGWTKVDQMRYGENPHQIGALYRDPISTETSVVDARILQGKKLSYNNVMDADAAFRCVREFPAPAAVIVKHTNPCGVAVDKDITSAFRRAYNADRLSAFGGIVALNRKCTKEIAGDLSKVFVEIVLAPEIDPEALTVFAGKPNVRVLATGLMTPAIDALELRQVVGGVLVHNRAPYTLTPSDLSIVTKISPTPEQIHDLLFAWTVAKFVKSNTIVVAKGGVTLGVGAGQMSRVDSTHVAIAKAGQGATGAVLASDAFFPFRDSIDAIARAGISAIIQPGGSIKDQEVIEACNEYNIAMVFTGKRAFLH
ncbi:bifunctional phosphoribosylaminoimidazolecarboxamide formyltransferase/IMP cyclohydrolase [Candidatus Uhrbacteria bacterium]|nr:bifunctional phosphoribosylaminoimidazolecarboxamide formyltransferase/IMP cyclohydrolase [Candidatus Uhrbacteria bacterium]